MIVPAENDPADFMKYFLIAVILVIFCQLGAVLWRRRKDPIMWYYIAMVQTGRPSLLRCLRDAF